MSKAPEKLKRNGKSSKGKKRSKDAGRDAGKDEEEDMKGLTSTNGVWPPANFKDILREAFVVMDKIGNGSIHRQDVGTLLRYLGQFPDESDLRDKILPEIFSKLAEGESKPSTTFSSDSEMLSSISTNNVTVNYSSFESVATRCVSKRLYDMDDPDLLLEAFRTLDSSGNGYLDVEVLRTHLQSDPDGLREKELTDLLDFTEDRGSSPGLIYYEDYVLNFRSFVNGHLQALYGGGY